MELSFRNRKSHRGRRAWRRTNRSQLRSPKLRVSTVKVKQAWRATRLRLLGAALLLGMLGLLTYAFRSYNFYIYDAEITGYHWLKREAIYAAAGVHTQNIFWLSPAEVAASVEALPGVREAKVQVWLPATVRIQVEEREPEMIWRTADGDLWLDRDAVALPYGGDPTGAVFVVDRSGQTYRPNDRVEPDVVASVQALQAEFPEVHTYYYQAHEGLTFASPEGWPIQIGTSQDMARKVAVLKALGKWLRDRGIQPINVDLRLVDHPVYAVASGPAAPAGGD